MSDEWMSGFLFRYSVKVHLSGSSKYRSPPADFFVIGHLDTGRLMNGTSSPPRVLSPILGYR